MDAAPFFADVADGPASAHAVWVRTSDGLRLRLGVFPRDGARGTVLILPGRTEYVEKYARTAVEFGQRGWASLAIDWRGQGLSGGRLPARPLVGHVRRFADYQQDLAAAVAAVAALGLPRPLMMVAHSMGGAIGLRGLIAGTADVAAVVFSAPMWGILVPPPATRARARAISGAARLLGLGHLPVPGTNRTGYFLETRFEDNGLTTDPAMWDWMRAQVTRHPDLALAGPGLQWLNEALRELDDLHRRPSPDVPCLTVMGSAEAIVDTAAIRARMDRWPGGHLSVYTGARHEIPMEAPAHRARFLDEACALFDRATDGG